MTTQNHRIRELFDWRMAKTDGVVARSETLNARSWGKTQTALNIDVSAEHGDQSASFRTDSGQRDGDAEIESGEQNQELNQGDSSSSASDDDGAEPPGKEQHLLAHGFTFGSANSKVHNSSLAPEILGAWESKIQQWSQNGSLLAAAQEALILTDTTPKYLNDLIGAWSNANYDEIPKIELLSHTDINRALGAYAQSTGVIYLNADWLKAANQEAINAVLTEELGHYLDSKLNEKDTQGDEGEYFSDLLRGDVLTDSQKADLRAENDSGLITVRNQALRVEYAVANSVPSVSVVAIANGNESDGSPVIFRFERNGDTSVGLEVGYTLFGTAQSGSDYTGTKTGTISFAIGSSTATLSLPVLADKVIDTGETIIARITPSSSYFITTGKQTATGAITAEGVAVTINVSSQDIAKVASNAGAFAAIKSDGTIVAWGDANSGGIAPEGLTGVSKIFSNPGCFVAIKSDGTVVAWGDPYAGGIAPTGLSGVSQIYSNYFAFATIQSDSSVVAWGDPDYGGIVPTGLTGVTQIFSNPGCFVAIKSDGTVVAWGDPYSGGIAPTGLSGVSQIFSNYFAFATIQSDSSVVAWGDPDYGGIVPTGLTGVTEVFSSYLAFAALKSDGTVVAWGDPDYGGIVPNGLTGVSKIFSNYFAFAALKVDGSVINWGNLYAGGDSSSVSSKLSSGVIQIFSTYSAFAALKSDGTVVSWGYSNYGGDAPAGLNDVTQIYANGGAFTALKRDGTVVGWGDPSYGGISPAGLTGVTRIVANASSFTALKSDGTVVSWGDPGYGGTAPAGLGGIVSFANPDTNDQLINFAGKAGAITAQGNAPFSEGVSLQAGNINSDPDGIASITVYQWYLNNAAINGATAAKYTTSSTGFGSYRVDISYVDGQGVSAIVASANQVVNQINFLRSTPLGYSIQKGENTPIQVTYNGQNISPSNPGAGWVGLAATVDGTGFDMYVKNTITGQYVKWILDTKGAIVGGAFLTSAQELQEETTIGYDINGDGTTGLTYTAGSATIGSVNLGTTQLGYAIKKGLSTSVQVTYNGDYISPTFPGAGWVGLAAAVDGTGFDMYVKNTITGQYVKWILDTKGAIVGGAFLTSAQELQEETTIGYDINGDGTTGLTYTAGTATLGSVNLGTTQLGYAIKKGLNSSVQVTYNGDYISPTYPGAGWIGLAATIDGAGYVMFVKNTISGQYVKWILDTKGAIVGGAFLTPAQELQEETTAGYDINGDGTLGNNTITSSTSYVLAINQDNLILTGGGSINGTGNSLNNIIIGNSGINILDGKDGVDTLTGLEGGDNFLFSTAPVYGGLTADHITDIDIAQGDLIQISRSAFGMDANTVSSLTTISDSSQLTSALGTNNSFVYDSSNGYLYWNQNGSVGGSGSGGVFAILDNKASIAASTISLL